MLGGNLGSLLYGDVYVCTESSDTVIHPTKLFYHRICFKRMCMELKQHGPRRNLISISTVFSNCMTENLGFLELSFKKIKCIDM